MRTKLLMCLVSLIGVSGCGVQQEVTLIHPTTKAEAHCSAHGAGFTGRIIAASELDDCIKKYEAQGYVRQESE